MPTNVRDPRGIITPDAFELSKDLLGTPLAPPWRRFWAMLIDVVVIGVLTAVTASISLILWGGVALFFIVMAFRAPGRGMSSVASMLFRGATGCLGTAILIGVLIAYVVVRAGDDFGEELVEGIASSAGQVDEGGAGVGADRVVRGLAGLAGLRGAEDADEAVDLLVEILDMAPEELGEEELRGIVDEMAPADAPWRSELDSVVLRALRESGRVPDEDAVVEGEALSGDEALTEIEALSEAEALRRLADLEDASALEPLTGADALLYEGLRRRLSATLASDSLEALAERVDDAEDDLRTARRRLSEARNELESGDSGFLALIRDIWDQAGSAIGLWSVYFTVALTLTGGRTVGKKMLGLRVLRLDGEPLNWWASFERAGGYVAGIATGTLGFAQVFWDPNRQCVHDKIVGTVVVVDGAQIEPGAWQEAWAAHKEKTMEKEVDS